MSAKYAPVAIFAALIAMVVMNVAMPAKKWPVYIACNVVVDISLLFLYFIIRGTK